MSPSAAQLAPALGVSGAALLVPLAIALVIWLVVVPLGLRGIFEALAADRSRAWIPFVNIATVYRLGGRSEFWLIALVIPVANIVGAIVLFVATHRINRRLGRSAWYTVLAVVAWWVWALALGLQRRIDRTVSVEPLVWSVQQRPLASLTIPGGDDSTSRPRGAASHIGTGDRSAPLVPPMPPASTGAGEVSERDAAIGRLFDGLVSLDPIDPVEPSQGSPRTATTVAPITLPEPLANPAAPPAAPAIPLVDAAPAPAPAPSPAAPAIPLVDAAPAPAPAPSPAAPAPDAASADSADSAAIDNDETILIPGRFDQDETILTGGRADATVVSPRRRPRWWVRTAMGARVELTGAVAVLGRHPAPHPLYPGAQLIQVTDDALSVSATHAALEFVGGEWHVTDLDSTNGVWLVDADTGAESELGARNRARVTATFMLGELGVQVTQDA